MFHMTTILVYLYSDVVVEINETLATETSGAVTICVVFDSGTERPLDFVITPFEDGDATGLYG